jgi:hypothetical protein
MFVPRLPFDYVQHIDRGDRLRRARGRSHGRRVRRTAAGR